MGKRSREKATGKSLKERLSGARERMRLRRPARRMAKRMQRTGDYREFQELVSELEDEDIEEFLRKLDKAILRWKSVALDPLTQTEYQILVDERTRREKR